MCWSGEASAALATVGFASTAYVAYKGEDKAVWIPLAYFSLMEMLQAATYPVINQCELPRNQVLTLLGNLHIVFQPFFINMVSLHFIPAQVRRKVEPYVYGLCFLGAVILLLRIYPFEWAGTCQIGYEPLCGERLCSVSGNWHIAWEVPSNGLTWTMLGYFIPAFLIPILYGSWRCTIYHILAGPLLAFTLTDNMNEWPAVWCLMSIGLILLVAKTPVRRFLYVQRWWFWGSPNIIQYTEAEITPQFLVKGD
jgi:hypothetical protein